ncbi:N-acetylmuramoyl-L-alanine amidase [Halpernia frigidisoli]|uniref:N-acetylmuramoyl-L-alanine amidase n=1 Tax=Halpernia frigidisoli TaxID=1125876 RepID=A0A1I3IXF0_9FLAO|nr:N-acetylmuramoyl-L-alanine amidase [Halpernia frigidisoli]SFI52614.1 N-acetylmuramoyl-L-alanine amidase [Halpernia frigidisoli]
MRKSLYIISLGISLLSCETQNKVVQTVKPKPTPQKQVQPPKIVKPPVETERGEYFTVNLADAAKNDNTISFGSIVSAKPAQYNVVKTYFPALAQNFRQKYLVLHYTALDDEKSIRVLTEQTVSAHYLVNDLDDKEIYQLVDENKRAYHAGISAWRKDKNLNDNSIGIEIVNMGFTSDATGKKVFVPFPEYQFKKVAALAKNIATRYMIPPTNILGHSDIAPGRKQDPGPNFPWERLYKEYQLGMWYDDAVKQAFYDLAVSTDFQSQVITSPFIFKVQTMLQGFGYDVQPSGTMDDATKKTIETFQYHFRPANYDGILDPETYAILQALVQKYP